MNAISATSLLGRFATRWFPAALKETGGRRAGPGIAVGRSGYTLLELAAAVTIVAVLAALFIGVSKNIYSSKNEAMCALNLRNIGIVIYQYAAEYNGDLVPTLARSEMNPNTGEPWFQRLHKAGLFPVGPPKGPRGYPSWHLNSKGMFTCPSTQGRDSGRARHMQDHGLTAAESFLSTYDYNGIHYGMFSTVGGLNNLRDSNQGPLKLASFPNPSSLPMVGETDYQYYLKPKGASFKAYPHREGMNVLFLDGSVRYQPRTEDASGP